jgi:hypothetical protein
VLWPPTVDLFLLWAISQLRVYSGYWNLNTTVNQTVWTMTCGHLNCMWANPECSQLNIFTVTLWMINFISR